MATFDHKKLMTSRYLSRRYIVTAAIAIGALTIGGYVYWRFRVIGTLVECLKTGRYGRGEILLRTTSPDNDTLLIGPVSSSDGNSIRLAGAEPMPTGPVYRFEPGDARLRVSGLHEWAQATGTVTYRYLKRDITTEPIKNDIQTGLLSIGGVSIRTAGAYVIDTDVSPDRSIVNVISANARRTTGDWFLGGGYPRGPYYHETFERLTGKKLGGTYTLKDPEPLYLSFCWEALGKYIVYHDGHGKFLWIVPGPNQPSSEVTPQGAAQAFHPAPSHSGARPISRWVFIKQMSSINASSGSGGSPEGSAVRTILFPSWSAVRRLRVLLADQLQQRLAQACANGHRLLRIFLVGRFTGVSKARTHTR
jgi:hypothetical protein